MKLQILSPLLGIHLLNRREFVGTGAWMVIIIKTNEIHVNRKPRTSRGALFPTCTICPWNFVWETYLTHILEKTSSVYKF
jgi:hypothetical protein